MTDRRQQEIDLLLEGVGITSSPDRESHGRAPRCHRVTRPHGTHRDHRHRGRIYVRFGVTGFLRIDENGDRESDYSLWDMDPMSGNFQIVANYNGTTKELHTVPGRDIHWPGNSVPSDVPPCGFDNSDPQCRKANLSTLEVLSLALSLVLLAITVISFFIYRKLQLEKELAAELWRVRWEDLQMSSMEKHLRSAGSKLTLSLRGSNYGSLMTAEGQFQVYAKTAYYKGNLVAVKHLNRKRIELTRKVLFELKHDILENESITLDWMFRYSLTLDIVK
ncbi:UNVERIFIED_CONTAM: hypothetical protein H355_002709, partial [Colinus virginianus]